MLLPRVCGGCGASGGPVCAACSARLVPAGPLPPPPGAERALAVLRFEGAGRDLVLGLKYRNRRSATVPLAAAMAQAVAGQRFDVVTWAPTSAARRRARGFDQARLLAQAVGRQMGCPCRGLLRRRPGPPQTGLDRHGRSDRLTGPAFVARGTTTGRVLLVDDVVTTGATVAAATLALRAAGAESVVVIAAAATPLKVAR
jgi:predicted amidophosphoribosyltransferase